MKPLTNIAAERAVLAGICQFGYNAYIDIADIIDEECFTSSMNKVVFACVEDCFKGEPSNKIDTASIYSAATNLGLIEVITNSSYNEHILSMFNFGVDSTNIRKLAAKLKKLSIARKYREVLATSQTELLAVDGSESISKIISIGESGIFDYTSALTGIDSDPELLGKGLVEYIQDRINNPVDQLGIPTGLPRYDAVIGGGLRPGTVNMISARPKVGKTVLSSNIGFYIADTLKIPVLNLDTEMTMKDHQHRTLAMMTDAFIHDIETGKFVQKPGHEKKVLEAAKKLEEEKTPYYHKSIAGVSFDEQLSIIRRWIMKAVGLQSNGHANQCVLIYDYLKLMTSENINSSLSEFQLLGFMLTELHNLSIKYQFPILCFSQLNRDGIDSESTDTVAGSDRIIWFCSNFTIFKLKSSEEIGLDGAENGNRKLVCHTARHGSGMTPGNYINCHMKGETSKITEGLTRFELNQQRNSESSESTDS